MRKRTGIALLAATAVGFFGGCSSTPKPPPDPAMTVSWPGSPYYGSRTIPIKISVQNPTAGLQVQAKLGQAVVAGPTALGADGTLTLSVTLNNGANSIEVLFTDSATPPHTGSDSRTVVYPFINLTSFQQASFVIGQSAMDSVASGTTADTLNNPIGNPAITGNMLLVPDTYNNRVLGYSPLPTGNTTTATFVLGQTDFVSGGVKTGAAGLKWPQTVVVSNGKLLVTVNAGRKVQLFDPMPDPIPANYGTPATWVIGQANQDVASIICNDSTTYNPSSIFVSEKGQLLVADDWNDRILLYDSIPTSDGAAANMVIGEPNFTTCTPNAGAGFTSPTASTMYDPSDVWTDGSRLLVADPGNGRVLLWNTFPPQSDSPVIVLGQADAVTVNQTLTTRQDMKYPSFIASNGNQIFVADFGLNRVLVWNSFPTSNHQPADLVLGQNSFSLNAANDDNHDGTPDSKPSDRTLNRPNGLLLTDTQLYVTDTGNNRILVFNGQ